MKSLTSTLLEAQKSSARLPYVKVEVVDRVGGVRRLTWSRLYSGNEPDFRYAVTMPGDGSLVRLRVDPANDIEYRQRVVNPGPESDFSTWQATGNLVYGVALCSQGSEVLEFHIEADDHLYRRESNDYGASWGTPIDMGVIPGGGSQITAAFNEQGDVALFYSIVGAVYAIKRTSGNWGAPAAWTNSVADVTGLACVYLGDWNVMVSGRDSSNNYKVWTCVYGDGYSLSPGTWSSLAELTVASAGAGVEFHHPSIAYPDVCRAFFVEKYWGTASYSRPCWSHSLATADFTSNLWREPVPFNLSSGYGVAITHHGSYVWLSSACGAWRASLNPAAVELTDDVVKITAVTKPFSGRVAVLLGNDDGRFKDIGSGGYAAIKQGSEIRVCPGYRTSAGAEFCIGPAYWIEGWEYIFEGGRSYFLLQGSDGWGLLDHWRARRQFTWDKGQNNIFQLLSFIFARAGLEFSAYSTSEALVSQYPAFTIHPRESGATAARRLLAMVPDVLFFLRHCGYVKNPLPDEEGTYSFGTDHAILEGRYTAGAQEINRVQVYGDGIISERFDWDEIADIYDRLGQVHDLNLDTLAKAEARGDAELRAEEIAARGGEVVVPTNCGQDLYDVAEITDERAGLSAVRRRIMEITLRYSTLGTEAHYQQRLRLGGV